MNQHDLSTADPACVIGNFKTDLQHMRREAGNPSYRELVRRSCIRPISSDRLSTATLGRAFTGDTMPSWTTVELILTCCGITEDTITSWKQRWAAAMDVIHPLPQQQRSEQATVTAATPDHVPDGHECLSCGSWVTNTARHTEWHNSITPAYSGQSGSRRHRTALRRVG